MKKLYEGICDKSAGDRRVVIVTLESGVKHELKHHVKHSPDGFAWGYHGSGPTELARCILWDHLGYEPHPALYQNFKLGYVANWPNTEDWALNSDAIESWLYLNRYLPRSRKARGVT